MKKGPLPLEMTEPTNPVYKYAEPLIKAGAYNNKAPATPQVFGSAAKEHMDKYKTELSHLHKISVKNYKHGYNNPYAQFRKVYSQEEVAKSPMISYPLNKLQCCPTSDGAACAIICNEEFVNRYKLADQAVEVLASVLGTDIKETFSNNSAMSLIGYDLTRRTAEKAYKIANVRPEDIKVIELHDCFSANELITYESLGLCKEGEAKNFIDQGDNTYKGKHVVNPSGGLTSKGHPLGATGLAQITELTWQLRRMADKRQVDNVKYALAHNLGLGSALVVSILKKYNDKYSSKEHQTSDPDELQKYESKLELQKSGRPRF